MSFTLAIPRTTVAHPELSASGKPRFYPEGDRFCQRRHHGGAGWRGRSWWQRRSDASLDGVCARRPCRAAGRSRETVPRSNKETDKKGKGGKVWCQPRHKPIPGRAIPPASDPVRRFGSQRPGDRDWLEKLWGMAGISGPVQLQILWRLRHNTAQADISWVSPGALPK